MPEIFFGGSRGGGKTDGVLGKWALKEKRYGKNFNARMFRKTSVSSEDAIERAKEIYIPLGAKFNETKSFFRMPNGGRVAFGYLDQISDADAQQGKNLTDAWVEEAGQYASPAVIDKLFGALRSAHGVPTQMVLTANPGGAGQGWIRERYKLVPFPVGPKIVTRELPNGAVHEMAVIPSRIADNKILLHGDPGYINRLHLVGSTQLVSAWLNGDWNAVEGAFFGEWDEAKHVVPPFTIPEDWLRFRAFDWGSAAPFSAGWWTVIADPVKIPGRDRMLPRGALVRYREWYGASKPNVGLKLTTEEVAEGIKSREGKEKITNSVADPAIFSEDGGPSRSEVFARHGVHFRPADNKRVARLGAMGGWDEMRQRLKGEDGVPMIYTFSTCVDSIRTIPVLQHDVMRPEDLDTSAEDHAADEWRYACMSRPWIKKAKEPAIKPDQSYRPIKIERDDEFSTL